MGNCSTLRLCPCVRPCGRLHVRVFPAVCPCPRRLHACPCPCPCTIGMPAPVPMVCGCVRCLCLYVPCPPSPVSISVPRVLLARLSDPFLIFKLVTHRRIEVSPRDLIYTRCATAPLYTCTHVCVRASMSVPAYPQPLSRAPCLRGAPYSKTQGQQMENTLEIAIPRQKECLFFVCSIQFFLFNRFKASCRSLHEDRPASHCTRSPHRDIYTSMREVRVVELC